MLSALNFTRGEQKEIRNADTSRRLWLRGPGRVFWQNALANARSDGQRREVERRLAEAKRRGA